MQVHKRCFADFLPADEGSTTTYPAHWTGWGEHLKDETEGCWTALRFTLFMSQYVGRDNRALGPTARRPNLGPSAGPNLGPGLDNQVRKNPCLPLRAERACAEDLGWESWRWWARAHYGRIPRVTSEPSQAKPSLAAIRLVLDECCLVAESQGLGGFPRRISHGGSRGYCMP